MKPGILLPALLWLVLTGRAATAQQHVNAPEPPGTIRLAENLFIDESEVANIHWLEYLQRIRLDSSETYYRSQLPDSTVWKAMAAAPPTAVAGIPTAIIYFRYPGFRYYPVVGISYEQAVAYCKWRSAVVNESLLQSTDFRKKHPELRGYDLTVEYRLPTEAEWQQAAAGSLGSGHTPAALVPPSPKARPKPVATRKEPGLDSCLVALQIPAASAIYKLPYNLRENYYTTETNQVFECSAKPGQLGLEYVYVNPANYLGLYNIIGNAAEMTATKGIAKGGSFQSSVLSLKLESRQLYQGPQSWLGFRCVATVRMVRRVGQ
ncbi:SUMF1/EgtB/PvdO family nonheme iron enzyme [Microvirga sp. STR05]|uniref:SUMF1/EgtB/PvdO family nonheme iron enzyme n=1 Tax=Hymenobacter duratus TaxID=2771356 RepID=A0ABR8JEJ5_9BACT|nr:SUMF1/EgtB/PvdO family nonheme iron enzyme [Hymenobacter duratus]MBD2715283.1 SUMF1/EgtB/PvdO family nonheme iron enzyme [Hymenobacter duratus]MBR7950190.1 SUMF1/EgtB/PvdO family nonheme iron enzyme [Microvirga sp. STR05]